MRFVNVHIIKIQIQVQFGVQLEAIRILFLRLCDVMDVKLDT